MILTVTPNPALDRVIFIDEFTPGGIMRAGKYVHSVGGKALDASVVLQTLGGPNVALTFLAGPTGEQLAAILDGYGIRHDDVWVGGETRVANVIVETRQGRHSHLVIGGLAIGPEHLTEYLRRYAGHLEDASWVVTGGALPAVLAPDFYRTVVRMAGDAGVSSLVDSTGAPILAMLERVRPTVLKMNRGEFCTTFGMEVRPDGVDDLAACAGELAGRLNLPGLVITCGPDGILALVEGRAYLAASPPQVEVNAAGAGDGASAALAHRLASGDTWPEALRWAAATSAAVVLTEGTADCNIAHIERILRETTVRELS